MTAIYLIGMGITAAAFALIFARRYPGHRGWLVIGIVIGLIAMILWPVTLWVALAMWLTGFARPRSQPRRDPMVRKRIVLPLAVLGGLGSLVIFGASVDPVPPTVTEVAPPAALTSPFPTTSPTPSPSPTTTASPTTSPLPATPTRAFVPAVPTSTSTPAPTPRPQPKPVPKPQPKPQPKPKPESGDQESENSTGGSANSGTRPRTGNSGHPCRAGERDGDGDGYCGER